MKHFGPLKFVILATEPADNKCNPCYISVTDPVIEDHQFTVSQTGSRLIFKITM